MHSSKHHRHPSPPPSTSVETPPQAPPSFLISQTRNLYRRHRSFPSSSTKPECPTLHRRHRSHPSSSALPPWSPTTTLLSSAKAKLPPSTPTSGLPSSAKPVLPPSRNLYRSHGSFPSSSAKPESTLHRRHRSHPSSSASPPSTPTSGFPSEPPPTEVVAGLAAWLCARPPFDLTASQEECQQSPTSVTLASALTSSSADDISDPSSLIVAGPLSVDSLHFQGFVEFNTEWGARPGNGSPAEIARVSRRNQSMPVQPVPPMLFSMLPHISMSVLDFWPGRRRRSTPLPISVTAEAPAPPQRWWLQEFLRVDTLVTNLGEIALVLSELLWHFGSVPTAIRWFSGCSVLMLVVLSGFSLRRGNQVTAGGWVEVGGAAVNVIASQVISVLNFSDEVKVMIKAVFGVVSRTVRKLVGEYAKKRWDT